MSTGLTNAEVAARLEQLAVLLGEGGADRYKVRAYRNAAASLRTYPASVAGMVAAGEDVRAIPGVGKSIAGAIEEVVRTGTLAASERLGGGGPRVAVELAAAARLPLRDAKRAVEALGVSDLEEARRAVEGGGGGALTPKVLFQLRRWAGGLERVLWADAEELAAVFKGVLGGVRGVTRVEVAGEVRRGVETVGELASVVACADFERVAGAIEGHAGVSGVRRERAGVLTGRLAAGPRLRVRAGTERGWGDAVVEETGSSAHLAEVRRVVKGRFAPAGTEEEWYARRGMAFIAPELREGRGEVAAALRGELPTLVEVGDIRGDLHCHTTASDGAGTLAEMARAARALGYAYMAVTDHSKSLKITRGLDEARLAAQGREVDAYNRRVKGFRVLKGSEVDILADGSLDFADEVLAGLDVAIASVHSRFGLDREQQTERVLRAVANPYLTCVGHLTGRLLLKRPGYELDTERVLRAVKRHGKLLEINSSPDRLDIDDELARRARELGIPILVNTDAHSTRELGFMRYGVQQARRGWRDRGWVVNTLPLAGLMRVLRGTRAGAGRAAA